MSQYSIKEIESLSGIKAHTLRIWEQRYDFLSPHRTDTNIRYYTDEQLKKVLNIAVLNKNGYKISKIVEMSSEQIHDIVTGITEVSPTPDGMMDALIQSMVDFDEGRFEKTLNQAILRMGFADTFTKLLLPFLNRTGVLWSTEVIKPVQEHFISNLIKRKLCVAIDNQFITKGPKTRKIVLFLPDGEWHELMLLFSDFLLRQQNHEVIYLGCAVPLDDFSTLKQIFHPDYLVSFVTSPMQHMSLQSYIDALSKLYPVIKLLIGGPQIGFQKPVLPPNVVFISSADDLLNNIH